MKNLTVTKNDANQRLDRFLMKTYYTLPKSVMYKYIRKKSIKINKKRATPEQILNEGDLIELYINDEFLCEKRRSYDFLKASKKLDIIYEDENIIIIDKPVGLLCHPDKNEFTDTAISRIKRYLYEERKWNPDDSKGFSPSICNRLDRNTQGLVIAAKNADSLRILNEKIKKREISKYYLAILNGTPKEKEGTIKGYLTKNEQKNKVSFSLEKKDNSKNSETRYRVLETKGDKSLVEVELITGRTHQIRVHFASIGCPLCDDGKYGKEQGRFRQKLFAYKLIFDFKTDAKELNYLNKKEIVASTNIFLKEF